MSSKVVFGLAVVLGRGRAYLLPLVVVIVVPVAKVRGALTATAGGRGHER